MSEHGGRSNEIDDIKESLRRGLADSAAGRVADLGSFTQYLDDECPRDGQSVAWHLHAEAGADGLPRTNGTFIGCDFGATKRLHARCASIQCAECYPELGARLSSPPGAPS